MSIVGPLSLLAKISAPFVRFLTASTNFFIKLFGGNPSANEDKITEEEIRMMVDVGEEKGAIQETEKDMINNIFEFDNTHVSEIMTHRTDIAALSIDSGLDEVLNTLSEEKFSRIPVFEENIDHIVGILNVKELIQFINKCPVNNFDLKGIVHQPYFVPASKMIDELFREMQKRKIHMAVAIDEYGGTAGIVTMEDLMEEIVGNIFDEYDEDEKEVEKIDENTFIFDGSTSLDSVVEYLGVKLPVEDYETIGGFMMGQLGRIPLDGENPEIEFNDIVFKVQEVDERRISKVKACKA
jgi:putative hemolysin